MMKRLLSAAAATALLSVAVDVTSRSTPRASAQPSPGVVIQKVFSGTKTLNGSP